MNEARNIMQIDVYEIIEGNHSKFFKSEATLHSIAVYMVLASDDLPFKPSEIELYVDQNQLFLIFND